MAGNGKKTKEAEQRAMMAEQQARAQQQAAEQARQQATTKAEETIKLDPAAQSVLDASKSDYDQVRSGNLTGVRGITNFLSGVANARSAAKRSSPTGAASLAFDAANPTLLAMNEQKLDAESANEVAAGVDRLAKETEAGAANNIMNVSGMKAGIGSNLVNFMFDNARIAQGAAGQSQNASESAWDRYKFEKSQKPFWQSAVLAGIGGAGQAASAYFGKKG